MSKIPVLLTVEEITVIALALNAAEKERYIDADDWDRLHKTLSRALYAFDPAAESMELRTKWEL